MAMNVIIRLLHVAAFLTTIPISVNGNDCTKEEFRCDDGTCIPIVQVCDISIDCLKGEDENQCSPTSCPEGLIRCFDECKYECETTTGPSDNQIISTTPLMNESDTNNLIYIMRKCGVHSSII